jgi:hypothetical protein
MERSRCVMTGCASSTNTMASLEVDYVHHSRLPSPPIRPHPGRGPQGVDAHKSHCSPLLRPRTLRPRSIRPRPGVPGSIMFKYLTENARCVPGHLIREYKPESGLPRQVRGGVGSGPPRACTSFSAPRPAVAPADHRRMKRLGGHEERGATTTLTPTGSDLCVQPRCADTAKTTQEAPTMPKPETRGCGIHVHQSNCRLSFFVRRD